MRKARFDAVLFDLDGTLADTAPDLIGALNAVLQEEGRMPMALTQLRSSVSRGGNGLIPLAFDIGLTHPDFARLKARFIEQYSAAICVQTQLFDGMDVILTQLIADRIPWGIVTNKIRSLTLKLLDAMQLPLPNCVVCGDDAIRAKPWPDTLLLAAKQLNVEPTRCVYVGDYHRDIEAARAAGMVSVAAAYGYREDEPPIETWGATYRIETPLGLQTIVWQDGV